MKYLIVLLSTLCLCENSFAAAGAGDEEATKTERRVSNASDLSKEIIEAYPDLDLDGVESAKMFAAARIQLEEELKSAAARNTQLRTDFIALRDHEEEGTTTLSETLAGIVQEVTDLEDGASASKLQIGTVRTINKFKSKLTEEDQAKIDAALAKLPVVE